MIDDARVKLEIAKLWKAFLGGLVLQIGINNMNTTTSPITIEPLAINATLIHLEEHSIALFMNLDTAEGTWSTRRDEQPLDERNWALSPHGVLVDLESEALDPLTAADSFVSVLSNMKKRKN